MTEFLQAPLTLDNATEVKVEDSIEKWSEFTLSDGAVVRVKLTVVSALRANDQYDEEGNPIYSLNMAPLITVLHNQALSKHQ